jgi:hypothetical protein
MEAQHAQRRTAKTEGTRVAFRDTAMPVRLLDDSRAALLVCDDCDAVMGRTGTTAPKRHRESDPDDLAPYYMPHADACATAGDAGWTEETEGRWSCPPCASRRPAPG